MAQTQTQTQAQTQTPKQKNQLIRLSKSGKSYVYQGNYYKLDDKMYICENNTAFIEIYNKYCNQQQYLRSIVKYYFQRSSFILLREYDVMLIKEMIHMVIIVNRNYDKIFNHIGLGYRLVHPVEITKPIMYVLLNHAKYVLRILSASNCQLVMSKQLRNQGIRETTLFIAMMSKHLAYHRKKMVNYLPRLLGHRIDDNIATIIYEYCM